METFGEILKKLREATGLTTKNMALLLNIDEDSVMYFEEDYTEPGINILTRVAKIFDISIGYAAGLTNDPECKEDAFVKEVYVANALRTGDGEVGKNSIVGTAYISRSEMHGKDYFGLVVKDDSMAKARIFKDDVVIVRRQNFAHNGDVVVCALEDKPEMIRRYQKVGSDVVLYAEGDGMKYKTYKVDCDKTKLSIFGKVCEVRIKNI